MSRRTSDHALRPRSARPSGKQSGMATAELAKVLGVPTLAKDLDAVDQRVVRGAQGVPEGARRRPVRRARRAGEARASDDDDRLRADSAAARIDKRVATAGAAIELVQIGSLVHDDVIEDAPTRRGRPTLNATEGVPVALVVGDLVLARAGTARGRAGRGAIGAAVGVDGRDVRRSTRRDPGLRSTSTGRWTRISRRCAARRSALRCGVPRRRFHRRDVAPPARLRDDVRRCVRRDLPDGGRRPRSHR